MKTGVYSDAIKLKRQKESKEDELIIKMNEQLSNCEKNKNCVCNNCSDTKYDDLPLEDLENDCGLNSEDGCILYDKKNKEIEGIIKYFKTEEGKNFYDKCLTYNTGDKMVDQKENSYNKEKPYEFVNHPSHYNNYSVEVIDMMLCIYGPQKTFDFCEMNAYKYRMRMGTKPGIDINQDLEKERWYLKKAKEIKEKYKINGHCA